TPYEAARSYYTAFPTPVLTADEHFLDVMQVELVSGRWLNSFDQDTAARTAVVGIGLADEFGFREGNRTIKLNDLDYGVVGVVERYPLDPVFDNAVIIPASTADADFDVGLEPDTVYVRSDPAFTLETEAALPVAINLGGDIETSTTVLSDALEAEAAADSTLQIIVAAMGLLALIVGGVGIANVMSISVIQRSAEIGIRRALGHGRSLIAWQFLIESVAVGLLGGLAGALVGVGIVVYASRIAGWVFVLSPELDLFGIQLPSHYVGVPTLYLIGVGAALLTSVFAGLYPSVKAARLEPLETLRLG
ncbi:MAG TPA: hypothetical protein DDY35_10620, partial [Acidimicrobiaceae bacterium]|nr:hypothetical protein [Acidimicrobiaceae bacterium]